MEDRAARKDLENTLQKNLFERRGSIGKYRGWLQKVKRRVGADEIDSQVVSQTVQPTPYS